MKQSRLRLFYKKPSSTMRKHVSDGKHARPPWHRDIQNKPRQVIEQWKRRIRRCPLITPPDDVPGVTAERYLLAYFLTGRYATSVAMRARLPIFSMDRRDSHASRRTTPTCRHPLIYRKAKSPRHRMLTHH